MDKFYFDVFQNIDRALFYPHGPENKVSKGMVSGFIMRYQSLINLILDKRVISGKLLLVSYFDNGMFGCHLNAQ
jgi:hypothetical protein